MGLEHLTDARFLTFMERSAPTRAFAPDRNLGIMLYNYFGGPDGTQNWSWFAGLFRGNAADNLPAANSDINDWCGTLRVAGLPYYDEATPGRCLLHVGVSGSARRTGGVGGTFGNGLMQGFLGLDNRNSLISIALGNPPLGAPRSSSEFGVVGLEAAWVRGAFSLQGEYLFSATSDTVGINTNGGYLQASYFLTGENRGYDRRNKAFYRVNPYEPFFRVRTADGIATGIGAWELAARYSYTNLNSVPALLGAGVTTVPPTVIGTQENITLGVNWYLNPYSRIMCNYVHSISDYSFLGKSEGDHVGVRLQVDW
jgi:phosphate-selective porin OprO/OprP